MSVLPVGIGSSGGYEIPYSLRFRESNSAYLSRTFGTATARKTFTFSAWVKQCSRSTSTYNHVFTAYTDANNLSFLRFTDLSTLAYSDYQGGVTVSACSSNNVYRDYTAWMHIVLVVDVNNGTPALRQRLYVNGVEVSYGAGVNYTTQNPMINSTATHRLGGYAASTGFYFDGYMADVYFVDGYKTGTTVATYSDFGETNSDGVWVPKRYTSAYGTNGFYLDFRDGTSATTLGYDAAGSNDWTPSGISTTAGVTYDWMTDTPTNNYAVLNPLSQVTTNSSATTGSANLYISSGSANYSGFPATFPIPTTGKWGIKFKVTGTVAGSNDGQFGIACDSNGNPRTGAANADTSNWYTSVEIESFYTRNVRHKYSGGSVVTDLAGSAGSGATNDEYEFLIDRDAGTVIVKLNGSTIATVTGVPSTNSLFPFVTVYNTNGYFTTGYTPSDASYKSLCTANRASGSITTSGSFTGNASTDGPVVWLNGNPSTMTINGNAVTWGTHADKTAGGFKVRSSSASYNASGSNTYSVSVTGELFGDVAHDPNTAQGNP